MMCNEQAYSLAVEKLLNIRAPPRAEWIRGTEQRWLESNHLRPLNLSHMFSEDLLMTGLIISIFSDAHMGLY